MKAGRIKDFDIMTLVLGLLRLPSSHLLRPLVSGSPVLIQIETVGKISTLITPGCPA